MHVCVAVCVYVCVAVCVYESAAVCVYECCSLLLSRVSMLSCQWFVVYRVAKMCTWNGYTRVIIEHTRDNFSIASVPYTKLQSERSV